MAAWELMLPTVIRFLDMHRAGYLNFLDQLKTELNRIRYRAECSHLIYTIYSREDKQRGQPFKTDWKIAKKLSEWRLTDPTAGVDDIHDIIGMTVVVNFPSDRDTLAGYLLRLESMRKFMVYEREDKHERGYHAIHLRVRGRNRMEFPVERAEIQIKTMLHDGWGAKTHDLTYKSQGEIELTLHRHMEILGDVLQHLDDQSELIKNAIRERWDADRKQRELARDSLFLSLIDRTAVPHAAELEAQANEIYGQKSTLSTLDFGDPRMTMLSEKLDELKSRLGPTRDVCRLYTLFASIRALPDVLGTALNAIDEWQEATIGAPLDQVAARNFRALTYYAVGSLEKAVEASREALATATSVGSASAVILTKSNLAYFLSELAFGLPQRDHVMAIEAKSLSKEAFEAMDSPSSARDTRGSVLIALGDSEAEVREGLSLCQSAALLSTGKTRPVTEAYFRFHERRAFRRLLSFN